jgi:hypothetical protein
MQILTTFLSLHTLRSQPPGPTEARKSKIGTLLGFPTSPFVRKVNMCVETLGFSERVIFATTLTTPLDPNADLCKLNPLGKIPVSGFPVQ